MPGFLRSGHKINYEIVLGVEYVLSNNDVPLNIGKSSSMIIASNGT